MDDYLVNGHLTELAVILLPAQVVTLPVAILILTQICSSYWELMGMYIYFIYLSAFVCLFIYICLSVCLFMYLIVYVTYVCIYLFIYLSVYLSIYLILYLSIIPPSNLKESAVSK